jgi:hypothetical protein
MSTADEIRAMVDEIKRLKNENDEYKKRVRPITFQISDKGAVSVGGVSKNFQSLYSIQWQKIMHHSDELKAFMAEHIDELN